MTIKQWPADERPREKLLRCGASRLSDAELLAIFLGSGGRGEDAVAVGRRLIGEAGGLRPLLERLQKEGRGIGPVARCRLLAGLELGSRHWQEKLSRGEGLSSPRDAGELFRCRLRDRTNEVFAAAFLDTRHRLIAFEELAQGGIDGAEVHPREIVRRCLQHNAAALLVGHNHPSGVAEPSRADQLLTERLKQALGLIDVRLLDHFIIGDGPPLSLAERGWL
ncbi:RadC family protein [Pseudomarimonas arenosa]|uniref:DNA repair protein RadC n=1 Tax=Pseudomarimonas arenosa TaxID=2774145 RepID=A0AAW3ZLU4_9GAMM|nr:DNA repair protein RadC [Pseudomarimonas arenosa]MBD8527026.1 DNA repair protein RadC [Pseudomarimonas arenosa]